ncbi:MAG: TonB-dependent receptor [Erythrobacter sp.]
MTKSRLLASAAVLCGLQFSVQAHAQEAVQENAGTEAEEQSSSSVGSIIVTATKRETTLADTALTVSVVDGATIADQGVNEITEIFDTVPGLGFNISPGGLPAIKIRGIGTASANQTFEQSVGLFQDGVFKPRARQYRDAIFDVERVEVIKGAQGVVFGKNTSVGAISVTTTKPGDEFGGFISGSYETEFDSYSISGAIDAPLGDAVKFRFAALTSETGGFVENTLLGVTDGDTDRFALRATAVIEAAPNFTITLAGQHADSETVGNSFQIVQVLDPGLAFLGNAPFERAVDGDLDAGGGTTFPREFDEQQSTDFTATIDWEISDNITITSISAVSDLEYENVTDIFLIPPFPGLPTGSFSFSEDFSQFTQELRLDYQGDRTRVLAGVFYQSQDFNFVNNTALNLVLPSPSDFGGIDLGGFNIGGDFIAQTDQELEAFSGFVQVSHDFSDRFTVDVGVRISDETKEAVFAQFPQTLLGLPMIDFVTSTIIPGVPDDLLLPVADRAGVTLGTLVTPIVDLEDSFSDTSFDFAVTLSYDLNDDWLVYLSGSQGTKSGSFNNSIDINAADFNFILDEEVAQTIELGVKGSFAGGRGYFAAAAFFSSIDDFQESLFDITVGPAGMLVAENVDAETYGAEAEVRFEVFDGLIVNASAAYLNAENTTTGSDLTVAPEFTSNFGFDYNTSLGSDFEFDFGGNISTNSGFLHTPPQPPFPELESGSFILGDVYASFTHPDSGITLRADIANLFDEQYVTFESPAALLPLTNGTFNRPRTVRFSATVRF